MLDTLRQDWARSLARAAPATAAGALVVWLAFRSGGFFAGATAIALVAGGLALVVWLTVARRPFAALTAPLGAVLVALLVYALWTLASAGWSGADSRALLEFDRALLYAFAAAFAGLALGARRMRAGLVRAIAAAFAAVCACALITRLLPHFWPVEPTVQPDRLSYPVSYWNALGMVAALSVMLCLHLASRRREPVAVRALAAACAPVAACTLLFSFSRGSVAALVLGAGAYVVLARPKGLLRGLVAIVPPTAVAVVACYQADAVLNEVRATPEVVSQGHTLSWIVAACVVVAAGAMVATGVVDRLAATWAARMPWRGVTIVAATALAAVVVVLLVAGVPQRAVSRFVEGDRVVTQRGDRQARLTDLGNNGRLDLWRTSLDAFADHPLKGTGAGTFPLSWHRDSTLPFEANDGHSLYLEVMGELGIVGILLILGVVLTMLVVGASRIRGPDRTTAAITFSVVLVWALHAGLDWDWEMPVLTLPVLLLGAAGIAGEGEALPTAEAAPPPQWPGPIPRLVGGIALLAVLWMPFQVARSQAALHAAVASLRADHCEQAIGSALDSIHRVGRRPEPYEVLAFCDSRLGLGRLSLQAANSAVARDPGSWTPRYQLALIRALQGLDPRPQLRQARERSPHSFLVAKVTEMFAEAPRSQWPTIAGEVTFPI